MTDMPHEVFCPKSLGKLGMHEWQSFQDLRKCRLCGQRQKTIWVNV